ncbi:hypothetical protein [Fluviispira sanaruensis]|uniref:Uncharacterized protein n=1 Tax=Fluviispira sanaruensis TaxID=2493639 RepID=A0A4V0P242_FLUSA|nr:hypothetical protein [Fluviispira sanaruensis]BBH51917.1 hypothetical protein JCM31447_03460 [Fluviispira sanaruensis]
MKIHSNLLYLFISISVNINAYSNSINDNSLIPDFHGDPLIYCSAYLMLSISTETSSIEGYISPEKPIFSSYSYLSKVSSPLKVRTKYFKLEPEDNKPCGSNVRENDLFYFTFAGNLSNLKIDLDNGRYYLANTDLNQPSHAFFLFSLVLNSGSTYVLKNDSNFLKCSSYGKCELTTDINESTHIKFIQLNTFYYQKA